mmetsp:Transcript_42008/g.115954  ORF Transcript_42008/g.115954 Transcript_42008/m.115954 type:complete len:230 (-) Transcript_42008:14-703(-)
MEPCHSLLFAARGHVLDGLNLLDEIRAEDLGMHQHQKPQRAKPLQRREVVPKQVRDTLPFEHILRFQGACSERVPQGCRYQYGHANELEPSQEAHLEASSRVEEALAVTDVRAECDRETVAHDTNRVQRHEDERYRSGKNPGLPQELGHAGEPAVRCDRQVLEYAHVAVLHVLKGVLCCDRHSMSLESALDVSQPWRVAATSSDVRHSATLPASERGATEVTEARWRAT